MNRRRPRSTACTGISGNAQRGQRKVLSFMSGSTSARAVNTGPTLGVLFVKSPEQLDTERRADPPGGPLCRPAGLRYPLSPRFRRARFTPRPPDSDNGSAPHPSLMDHASALERLLGLKA